VNADGTAANEAAEAGDAENAEDKEEKKDTVFYVTDEKQQIQYINLFKTEGINALILTHQIDTPYIAQLEQENDKITFRRIDSELSDDFKGSEADAKELEKQTEKLSKLFKKVLNKEKLEVKVESLKNENISSIITLSEEARRMQDMMKMYGMYGMPDNEDMFGGGETLVLNSNHPLVQYVLENKKEENTSLICEQLYDLAMLSNKPLSAEAMTKFVERSNKNMVMLTK